MPVTVLLAHSGRTLQLDCTSQTRVEEVQQAVAALTGVAVRDQILTCEGAPLVSGKALSAYGVSEDLQQDDKSATIFLYSRSLLRPDARFPPPEELPPPSPPPALEGSDDQDVPHPLDEAASPLLRALPQYRRQFQQHLRQGRAAAAAGADRVALCTRLVGQAEVQAASVDAAMASVEPHYQFICAAQADFLGKFNRRYAHHEDVLSRFEADLEFLHSIELPQALCTQGRSRLSHLIDVASLRSLAAECGRSHRHFATRVADLDALHAALRSDVEALFMRAPSVDLEALSSELSHAQALAEEQDGVAQVLAADAARADALLEAAVVCAPSASMHLSDTVGMLESMHESHSSSALPRAAECGAAIEAFAARCMEAKNALATDALRALRTVAAQQSKIREMREALAPFPAALDRQDADVTLLLVVRRLPAAYKQSLAECCRRSAFGEKYAAFAADLAERMGRFRSKEIAVRAKFRRHLEGLLPADLLEAMGLDQPPPHCEVNVPGDERAHLLPVTPDDLRRLPLPRGSGLFAGALAASASGGEGSPGASGSGTGGAAQGDYGATSASLQMENARLRAELASQVALDCVRVAEMAALAPPPPRVQGEAGTSSQPAGGASSSAAGAPTPLVLGADAAAKFDRALAAKDALISGLHSEIRAVRQQVGAYETRIRELEEQMTAASSVQMQMQRSQAAVSASMVSSAGAVDLAVLASSSPAAAQPAPALGRLQTPSEGSQHSQHMLEEGSISGEGDDAMRAKQEHQNHEQESQVPGAPQVASPTLEGSETAEE